MQVAFYEPGHYKAVTERQLNTNELNQAGFGVEHQDDVGQGERTMTSSEQWCDNFGSCTDTLPTNNCDESSNASMSEAAGTEADHVESESRNEVEHVTARKKRKPGATKKRLQRKQSRVLGEAYETVAEKPAPARSMKARCTHEAIKSNQSFHCCKVSELMRQKTFSEFWSLPTWDAKRAFLKGMITTRASAVRRRKDTLQENLAKETFHEYHMPCEDGRMVKVCCALIANTLGINRKQILRWLLESATKSATTKQNTLQIERMVVTDWIDELPKVPSHYCRANTSRMYVESSFRSKSHMYKVYLDYAQSKKSKPVCRQIFCDILEEKKVSIHKPRKDQCDTCCSYQTGNVGQDAYEEHIIKKDEARMAKNEAKQKCSDNVVVLTMDVQSVLLAPKLLTSAIYYKRKLQVHNMTFYRLNDGDVRLYVWDESNGNVTANEFTSCVIHYISMLPASVTHVILISDGCAYQNRNRILSSALRNISQSQSRIIEQLILERGHTMMEADTVHAQLQTLFDHSVIYAPSDYVYLMRQARPEKPFVVENVNFSFFSNFESLSTNLLSIRPGSRTRDATVTDIRGMKYDNGEVLYKLRHPDEWSPMQSRSVLTRAHLQPLPPPLYSAPLKISKDKHNHLQELKALMPLEYHAFYDSLLHE